MFFVLFGSNLLAIKYLLCSKKRVYFLLLPLPKMQITTQITTLKNREWKPSWPAFRPRLWCNGGRVCLDKHSSRNEDGQQPLELFNFSDDFNPLLLYNTWRGRRRTIENNYYKQLYKKGILELSFSQLFSKNLGHLLKKDSVKTKLPITTFFFLFSVLHKWDVLTNYQWSCGGDINWIHSKDFRVYLWYNYSL